MEKLSPKLRKILGNIGWLLAERVLRMGVGFVTIAWIARYLGSDRFGLLNYAIAIVSILSMLAKLGLEKIVVRNLVCEPTSKYETLGTAFFLQLASGIAAFCLAIGLVLVLRPNDEIARLIVAIIAATVTLEAFNVIDLWFQSQVQSKYSVWAKNTAFLIVTIVRLILIQIEAPLIAFGWATLIEVGLSVVGLAIAYQLTNQQILAWQFQWHQAEDLIKESWPLILSSLAITIYLRVDQVMLGELADDQAVGLYSAATRLSEVWPFIAIAIVNSFTASLIEAKTISETIYYEKWQTLFNWLALIAYGIAIPMTFLSTPLISLIFGAEYSAAGNVLSVHIWSALFVFLGLAKGVWVVNEGLTGYASVSSISGAILNVLLNLLLIPIYREMGAAIATVVSYGFTDYVTCFLYPPARKIGWSMTKAIAFNGVTQIIRRRET